MLRNPADGYWACFGDGNQLASINRRVNVWKIHQSSPACWRSLLERNRNRGTEAPDTGPRRLKPSLGHVTGTTADRIGFIDAAAVAPTPIRASLPLSLEGTEHAPICFAGGAFCIATRRIRANIPNRRHHRTSGRHE